MMNDIYFAKVKENAKIPTKRTEDAGYDIYPCFEDGFLLIHPHTTIMIPTGLASSCSPDFCFVLKERGSTGSRGIAQRCGIIDSGYRGEWFVPITNTTSCEMVICKEEWIENFKRQSGPYLIYSYEKAICQALVIPVPETQVKEISYEELKDINSERGIGALGSSKK